MVKFIVAFYGFTLICVSFSYGNVVLPRDNQLPTNCGGYMFVEEEVVIDGPFNENCILQFETQQDHILAFSLVDGDIKDALQVLKIHDGFGINSPILKVENQIIHEVSRQNAPSVLYTASSEAIVRFSKMPDSNMKLKIQKAVNCPFNIGDNTQCGRVVDDVSCYCGIITLRNFYDQTLFCLDNKMKLVIFENKTEEDAVQAIWPGTASAYFTSLTDSRRDGTWIWESSMTILNSTSDYTNWFPGRPSYVANNVEDCMLYGGSYLQYWGDVNCAGTFRAICEAQP